MDDEMPKEKKLDSKINNNEEIKKKNKNSPKKSEKTDQDNSLSSPSMNQKYFPSKENYFGIKMSPEKIHLRSSSPRTNSPILNYFSNFSPPDENILENNNFRKIGPNFELSPNDYYIKKSLTQNFGNININDSRTLQERMAPFVNTGESNNFMAKNNYQMFNINNFNQMDNEMNEEDENEEEESDEDKAFTLTINNTNEKSSNKQSQDVTNENIDNINNVSKDNSKTSSDIKFNSNLQNNEQQFKNIINKREFKPYIPNKFRDIPEMMGYPKNFFQNNNFYYQNNNYINIPPNFNNINNYNNLDYSNNINNINEVKPSQSHNFYYKGDNYQINNNKEDPKEDDKKTGKIYTITEKDTVTTITSNNRVIKRINPNIYLNETIEFLAFNILPLSQDQAGCRFLQEKIDEDPKNTVKIFFNNIIPHILPIIKDPFGNYLIQKLYPYLTPEDFKTILEKISPHIVDLSSNNHGTRVVQNIINYLSNPELIDIFLNMIKPHIISFVKELHGVNIINKFVYLYPKSSNEINKIIVDNCSLLATHKYGCFYLQKILEGPDGQLKHELIKNLIDNCIVLLIDQFGNYVIQSILDLRNNKYSSDIALIISNNAPYYSKHRYSCNVIEKCFDFCGKKEKNILIEKLTTPEVISELILDEHGNYVIQKTLYYSDNEKRDEILNVIKSLIPQIKTKSFGDKLLTRLYSMYPNFDRTNNNNKDNIRNQYQNDFDKMNYWVKNKIGKGFQKRKNNYMNKFNLKEKESYKTKNKYDLFNDDINYNNKEININNSNVSMNKIYNINNNTINININSNIESKEKEIHSDNNIISLDKNNKEKSDINIFPELKKNKKNKKVNRTKKSSEELNNENIENNKKV